MIFNISKTSAGKTHQNNIIKIGQNDCCVKIANSRRDDIIPKGGCISNCRKRERLPSASPSGFLTAFGMTTYLMKKKGEERNGGKAAVSFLPVHFPFLSRQNNLNFYQIILYVCKVLKCSKMQLNECMERLYAATVLNVTAGYLHVGWRNSRRCQMRLYRWFGTRNRTRIGRIYADFLISLQKLLSGIILTLTGLRPCQVIAPTTCQAAKLLTGSNINFLRTNHVFKSLNY